MEWIASTYTHYLLQTRLQVYNDERRDKSGADKQTGVRREIYLFQKFAGNVPAYEACVQSGAVTEKVDAGGAVWCIERTFENSNTTTFTERHSFEGAVQLCSYIPRGLCS